MWLKNDLGSGNIYLIVRLCDIKMCEWNWLDIFERPVIVDNKSLSIPSQPQQICSLLAIQQLSVWGGRNVSHRTQMQTVFIN